MRKNCLAPEYIINFLNSEYILH